MTNGYTDIKKHRHDADHGRKPAENHPCGFKWAIEAKRVRNAKMIVVDPASRERPPLPTYSFKFAPVPISPSSAE